MLCDEAAVAYAAAATRSCAPRAPPPRIATAAPTKAAMPTSDSQSCSCVGWTDSARVGLKEMNEMKEGRREGGPRANDDEDVRDVAEMVQKEGRTSTLSHTHQRTFHAQNAALQASEPSRDARVLVWAQSCFPSGVVASSLDHASTD